MSTTEQDDFRRRVFYEWVQEYAKQVEATLPVSTDLILTERDRKWVKFSTAPPQTESASPASH